MNTKIQYDWKKMTITNQKTGLTLPMRIDTEGGKIDIWNPEINEWCWNDQATIDFINFLQLKNA